MKKVLFILNPKSGREQIRSKLLDILNVFSKAGLEVEVYVTQEAGEAQKMAERYGKRKDMIVCSGGDGTLNEVVSGIMAVERAKRPVIGYIPAGSTNDFASSLGLSRNMKTAAEDVINGRDFAVDVGRFGEDRYFVYVAAFGAFTEVSYKTPQETKNLLGHQAYMLEGVKRISGLRSYRMTFEWDGGRLEEEFILGMITNTVSIGGFKGLVGMDVALDDGEFEVLLVRTPRTPRDISSIVSYLLTREGENDCVYQFRARSIRVTSEDSIDWTLDGEFGGSRSTVQIENLRREAVIRSDPKKTGSEGSSLDILSEIAGIGQEEIR